MFTNKLLKVAVAFGIFFFAIHFFVLAQSRDQLEKQKKEALKHIREAEKILNQTQQKRAASLGQLVAINKQIESLQTLISSISKEISIINEDITENEIVINALENDLESLKEEYSAMIYSAYKSKNSFDKLSFIFAADDFFQFIMRVKYLEQYADAREKQVALINIVRNQLISNKTDLENSIAEKQTLLADQIEEKDKLQGLKNQQSNLIAELKQRESELIRDIERNKKDIEKLNTLIANLVKEEMEAEKGAERVLSTDLKKLSASFEENRNKLPWPVASGFISSKFGTNPHPLLKRVQVPNNGVNIQTSENEKVRAVFKGQVKRVAIIPGDFKHVVIIQHGEYFTVYASLREVYVSVGQEVETNEVIGEVNTRAGGDSEVHFEVWKNTEKLNPEIWLAEK